MNELGKCPNCGSKNLDYGTSKSEGEMLRFEVDCVDCKWCGYEWRGLPFIVYTTR